MLGFGLGLSHCGIKGGVADAPDFTGSAARALLAGETQGLAFDFATDQSAYIIDTGTPANNYDSIGIVSDGELVGPSGKLTYTSPSNKLTMQSDGYIKYQAHNLCLQSEDFTTTWLTGGTSVTSDSTTAPNGGATADTITADGTTAAHTVFQNIVAVANATYRVAVRAKAGTGNYLLIAPNDASANGAVALFDLSTGLVGSSNVNSLGSAYSNLSTSMTDLGSGWYLCEAILTIGSSTTLRTTIGLAADSTTTTWANSFSSSNTIYLWGAQVSRYPANTDYIKTTSAAKYALPLEYDTSGNCLGLLVEEARTNLCLQGADFSTTWTTTECTVSANAATAPNGLTHADKLIPSTNNAAHYVNQSITFTAAPYAFSAYCKADGYDYIQIFDSVAGTAYANFNLSTGAVGNTSDYTASIASVGNGWYRVCIVFTMTASARTMLFCPINADTASRAPAFAGDGTSGVLIWGAQAELGSFPTSPIITYGSTATRAADNISIATSAFPHSATAGTMYAYWQPRTVSGTHHVLSLSDGSLSESMLVRNIDTNPNFTVLDGFVSQANLDPGTASTAAQKISAAYEANNFGVCYDGGTVATDGSGTLPTVTTLGVGRSANVSSELAGGHIKSISYVPRRKTDAELQAETA